MASDTVESQLQDIREQLDVQAEAISKLAAVVSTLEGVDAAALSPYVLHLTKLRGPAVQAPTSESPAIDPSPSEPEAALVAPQ